jgi:hypothetical protein
VVEVDQVEHHQEIHQVEQVDQEVEVKELIQEMQYQEQLIPVEVEVEQNFWDHQEGLVDQVLL